MSYHPHIEMLQQYAQGSLDDVNAFTIAVHLESCPHCKEQVRSFEQECGFALEQEVPDNQTSVQSLEQMLASITQTEQIKDPIKLLRQPKTIDVNGRSMTLPLALSKLYDRIGEWRNYGGKVFSAPIAISGNARVNLMYMAEGVKVPEHTHKGFESTLVLHGGFSDEEGHYEVGDFLYKDASVKHSPQTQVGEDCLCLTVLTEPMIFTQGVARVFNMFGRGLYP